MRKRFCVLQITPHAPNSEHVNLFKDKDGSDFYFVTYEDRNEDALDFCPNTVWSETRNTLCEKVSKDYDYYAFIDHDMGLDPQGSLNAYGQIMKDLELNPAVLTYYPGRNLHTPYASDIAYLKSREYSCIPFTHNGIKIVHHSLLKWFFPLFTKFRVDIDACHMFNIQEIPFLKNVVCSHNMVHHNNPTKSKNEQVYNKNPNLAKLKMDEMWKYIMPSFKHMRIVDMYARTPHERYDSLTIKNAFVDIFKDKNIIPEKSSDDVDYFEIDKLENCFDLNHEYFSNKDFGGIE